MPTRQSRRNVVTGLTAACAASFLTGLRSSSGEALPETTVIRFAQTPGICTAPQYVAEELLRLEGFTDISYVPANAGVVQSEMLARGELDFGIQFTTAFILALDAASPIKMLTGVHVGCYELFAHGDIRTVLDLKGKRVGVGQGLSSAQVFLSVIAKHVGLDPGSDITWVTAEANPGQLFVEGKVDAFLAFPTMAQELRARNVGHVVVNSMRDAPWSQYFCCMLGSSTAFAEKNPIATKRVIRAILRGADLCATQPIRVTQLLVSRGRTSDYEYALKALQDIPYAKWREYDPEDTVRFFSLRLHETGTIQLTPQEIIKRGTDWRFLNELRREMKT